MNPIEEPRISKKDGMFVCECLSCGSANEFKAKSSALNSLKRGNCKKCKIDYRITNKKEEDNLLGIYLNDQGLWCSKCSLCGKEQAYKRKGHAKGSALNKSRCKKCACFENKVRPSFHREFRIIDIEKFEKNASARNLCWELNIDTVPNLFEEQNGKCALSGIIMIKHPKTWSIDRIDSNRGYELSNIQLVDKRLNMMKGTLSQDEFISLCSFVGTTHADKVKW